MRKIERVVVGAGVLLILFSPALSGAQAKPRIRIVATVFPLMEFAQEVAGERGEASLLLPAGAEVHTWQPRAGDVVKLASCDLFFYVGLGLEPWVDDLLRGLGKAKFRAVEMGRDLTIGTESERRGLPAAVARDPHIWLDFSLDLILIDRIKDLLCGIEPASDELFERNALAYKRKLEDLDGRFREGLASCRRRTVILGGHAAFSRLLSRYGLEQVALFGASPDAGPTPARLAEIVALARKQGIRVVYTEAGEPDKLALTLAREIGAETLLLDPGHNPPPGNRRRGRTFIEIMKDNLRSLADGCGR